MKEIPLTRGKVALVDDADCAVLSQWKWYATKSKGTWYAERQYRDPSQRNKKGKSKQIVVSMHRFLMDCPKGMEVDHRDGNGLNCQKKSNLRICTPHQNKMNKHRRKGSKYKGVFPYDGGNKWTVSMVVSGENIYLGMFTAEKAAAKCYDKVAELAFGEFASLNFPENEG